jgi:hypothetical protein
MTDSDDVDRLVALTGQLPPAQASYLEDDFVRNLFETVLDYMMQTPVVIKALQHYQDHHRDEVRTIDDLEEFLARFPDDKDGNTEAAVSLWGYKMWTRLHQLRDLIGYFRSIGVTDQESLRRWAQRSDFKRDFEGRVKGLGIAVYQWLVMRQGVETVKPDIHLHRFAERALGRRLSDTEVVGTLTEAAHRMGLAAYELDWRIWEASRGGPLPYPGEGSVDG